MARTTVLTENEGVYTVALKEDGQIVLRLTAVKEDDAKKIIENWVTGSTEFLTE